MALPLDTFCPGALHTCPAAPKSKANAPCPALKEEKWTWDGGRKEESEGKQQAAWMQRGKGEWNLKATSAHPAPSPTAQAWGEGEPPASH